MTFTLVRKLLRDARWPLLAVWVLLFAFSAFWVKIAQRVTTEIAPFFNGLAVIGKINPKLMDEVVFRGPGKVSQAVLGGADVRFERPSDFLAVELLHPVVVILASLWAVGRGASAVAGELDRGTMELLLSQPVPRNRLILAHLIADAVLIPLLCLAVFAGTQFGLWLVGPFVVDYSVLQKAVSDSGMPPAAAALLPTGSDVLPVDASGQPAALLHLGALMFALSGLSVAVSSVGRSRWRAVGFAALVVVLMFVANVVGQLWDDAGFVRPATAFFYYQPQKVWLRDEWLVAAGPVLVPAAAVLGGVGLAGYLFALRAFTRRDLPAPL